MAKEMIEVTSETKINNVTIKLISDKINGEILDTQVQIEGKHLCTISGRERSQFLRDLKFLVSKYAI